MAGCLSAADCTAETGLSGRVLTINAVTGSNFACRQGVLAVEAGQVTDRRLHVRIRRASSRRCQAWHLQEGHGRG